MQESESAPGEEGLKSDVMGARFNRRAGDRAKKPERKGPPLRPVWIVLILLVPCVALTLYYSQIAAPDVQETGSLLPTTSYALVASVGQFGPDWFRRARALVVTKSDQGLF